MNLVLVCCAVLGASLTACKGKTPSPTKSEPKAAVPAEDTSRPAAVPGKPAKFVRDLRRHPVEVDTSAPANVGAVPKDVERSESGLAWIVLKVGTGQTTPSAGDIVNLNFVGWTSEGKLVQESLTDGRPAAIAVGNMFPGLAEGVQTMVAGEKRRLWIPGKLAFGEANPGEPQVEGRPPLGMLVYDVELLGFEASPPRADESTPGE